MCTTREQSHPKQSESRRIAINRVAWQLYAEFPFAQAGRIGLRNEVKWAIIEEIAGWIWIAIPRTILVNQWGECEKWAIKRIADYEVRKLNNWSKEPSVAIIAWVSY